MSQYKMNYQRIHDQLIKRAKKRAWCKNTAPCYVEKHHITLRSLGGTDDLNNLVYVTAREHFLLHKLLYLIEPTSKQKSYAYISLVRLRNNRDSEIVNFSSREFERVRTVAAKLSSIRMKENNPGKNMRGTANFNNFCKWVTPQGTFDSIYDAEKATGLGKSTIHRRCLNPDVKVTAPRLGRAMIGKTWRELGYNHILNKEKL